jgi:hypothetical protein
MRKPAGQGDRIYNFAGYFNFAIGIEMFIIFDPDDRFNLDAATLAYRPTNGMIMGHINTERTNSNPLTQPVFQEFPTR